MAFIRSILKQGVLTVLAGYGWLRLYLSRTPSLLILTYHRILPLSDPARAAEQPGMVTSPEALERHIRLVKKLGAEPVHLSEWLERNNKGQTLPKLAVAFTFDDGWRDNYEHAYPLLKANNIPATIFLVTQMVGTNKIFWPEQVLRLLTSHNTPEDDQAFNWLYPHLPDSYCGRERSPFSLMEADEVITRLKSTDDSVILKGLEAVYQAHPEVAPEDGYRAILNNSELKEMSQHGLVRYGAHTRNHYRLNRLRDDQALMNEVIGSREDIQALGAFAVPIFCYPNGNITEKGEILVSDHYEAACTTKTGWNLADCNPYDLHRFNLHDGNSDSNRTLLATIGRGLL